MAKAFEVGESVLSEELLNKIDGKLDKSEAESDYRRKSEDITEDDLAPALRQQIQSGGGGGGPIVDENGNYVAYDDTALRTRIVALETDKMDKSGMTNYYKKDEIIHEANISPDYKNSVNQQINAVDSKVTNLETNKADKSELSGYRKKSEKISEIDLSQTLYDRILAGGGGGSGGGVSLETVQTMIGNLDSKKADKTQLDLVRKIADPIKMTDVDLSLKDALDKAVIAAAELPNKADKSELTLYRRNDDPIVLTDMDSELSSQLSIALNAANDIEAFVVEYMGGVVDEISENLNNTFGHQAQLDFPFQWEITTYHYPGNEGHYTVFWALNILYREIKSVIGRAADGGGPEVVGRLPVLEGRVDATESEISSLKTRLSSAEGEISSLKTRLSTAEGEITSLKTDLSNAESEISSLQTDLSTAQGEISDLQNDLSAAQTNITNLQDELDAEKGLVASLVSRIDVLEQMMAPPDETQE